MGLSHLKLPQEQIQTAGGEFTVRGLGFHDIVPIVERNLVVGQALFLKFVVEGGDVTEVLNNPTSLAAALAKIAPDLVAEIVAAGSDEEDVSLVRTHVPLPAQLEALEKIAKLTFATSSPKKVVEIVISVANGLSAAMADLGPSLIGSGLSEAK